MSEQILLHGKILGIEPFLVSAGPRGPADEELFAGRSRWLSLISEVLPRALLAELGLSRVLLGASGGGQFLLVLPGGRGTPPGGFSLLPRATWPDWAAARAFERMWSFTENLGDWSVVRKRLNEELQRKRSTPLAERAAGAFQPFAPPAASGESAADRYFSTQLGLKVREAATIGWSPDSPALVTPGSGKHTWALSSNLSLDGITLARHAAPSDDGKSAARAAVLAGRAQGQPLWGVLRGDVDNFLVRLRRLQTTRSTSSLRFSTSIFSPASSKCCAPCRVLEKGDHPLFRRRRFCRIWVVGCLILLARELQRLFQRFTEENLKDFPGAEAKTISMAMALASDPDAAFATVYEQAGRNLDLAKSADKDCIYLLGRVLEWKRLADAAELKDTIMQMMEEFRGRGGFWRNCAGFIKRRSWPEDRPTRMSLSTGWGGFSAALTAPWATRATVNSRSCARIW
jgi:CRISPR-associated protein Csm1